MATAMALRSDINRLNQRVIELELENENHEHQRAILVRENESLRKRSWYWYDKNRRLENTLRKIYRDPNITQEMVAKLAVAIRSIPYADRPTRKQMEKEQRSILAKIRRNNG